jgi:hypothetical protein
MNAATDSASKVTLIRELNDKLRTTCVGGALLSTDGIAALPEATRKRIMTAIRTFDAFTADNDPHGEHDFGAVEVDDLKVFFKIDNFDRAGEMHSPDATDPAVTLRVLTVMLAEEY